MAISKVVYKSSANATPVTWMDATSATAAAADITSPKTAMLADGVMTSGTGTGGGGSPSLDDFSGGNILAITSHGTEYIDTDYYPPYSGIFVTKLADANKTAYEHYWGAANGNSRLGLQRVSSEDKIRVYYITNGSYVDVAFTGYGSGSVITPAFAASTSETTGSATSYLLFFRGYYNGSVESIKASYTFYGLNIVAFDNTFIKKYRPWLENGTPCIKELVDGDIYYNNGTGTFDYIDLQGVVHSA